ncbi:serine/threonine-protein kinase [Rhizocola hellebori]|nr:serine/threonine-protein kinase [Rhizocola hellebori]
MAALTPGMRLHDRYQLAEPIGAGGMAQVWLATDLVLGRSVAVKTLDGRLAQDPQLRAGARREAQAAAKLAHPHITAVHDYGELTFDDGHVVPFLVMELLTGQTLAQAMHSDGPMPWERVATIAGQIASALAAAHAQGVVHQDIKPANVMLTPTGAKILDFGIAAIRGRPGSPDWISGTPAYAPPERLKQAVPDPSADIFSLGVLVYEMSTGRLPWPIETWEQAASVERKPPAPLPKPVPSKQILAALALDPAQRPAAAQLAAEFGDAGGDVTAAVSAAAVTRPSSPTLIANRGFLAGSAKVPERSTRMYDLTPVPAPARRRSPHLAAALTLVVLLIALGMVFLAAAFLQSGGGNGAQPLNPTKSPTAAAVPPPTLNATQAPASINEALTLMRRAVDLAAISGEISRDRVENLRDRINDIAERDRRNRPKDMINKLEDLRKEVSDMAEEGEMSPAVAAGLHTLIAQAIAQAQRQ